MDLVLHFRAVLESAEGKIQVEADNDAQPDQSLLKFGVRAGANPLLQAFGEIGKRQAVQHAGDQAGMSPRSRMMVATSSMRRSKARTQAGSKCPPLSDLR